MMIQIYPGASAWEINDLIDTVVSWNDEPVREVVLMNTHLHPFLSGRSPWLCEKDNREFFAEPGIAYENVQKAQNLQEFIKELEEKYNVNIRLD